MLTEEQIKNLKKGDEICMKVLFDSLCADKIQFKTPDFPNAYFLPPTAPKYAPNRRFKKGDKVRLVEWRGRAPIMYGANLFGIDEIVTVEEDENDEYDVLVNGKSARQVFHACHLELVTPVEESKTYRVVIDQHGYHIKNKDGLSLASYYDELHPNAHQAARNECDRLNAARLIQNPQ